MKAKFLKAKIVIFCVFGVFCFKTMAKAQEPMIMWVHPYLPATELIKKFTPLADYLSKESGLPIRVAVSKSYKSHIERVGEERMDFAYLGPASYVKIINIYGSKKLLARLEVNGSPVYHGMIVTREDSEIMTLSDLKGKKIAFGDPNSTMSHLIPRHMLKEAGVIPNNFVFLGTHTNVALAILGGYYDAGGLKEGVYYKYQKRGLRLLAQSFPVSEHLFVARKDIPESTINKLQQAMFDLKDTAILTSIKPSVTGLLPVTEEDYNYLNIVLRDLDKLKPE